MTFSCTAPAHPHTTWVAVCTALFSSTQGLNPQLVSGNLFLKSVGVALTDIQDVTFSIGEFARQNVFLNQTQLVRECVRHYAVQAMKNMHVLIFGLDFMGNPVGMIKVSLYGLGRYMIQKKMFPNFDLNVVLVLLG